MKVNFEDEKNTGKNENNDINNLIEDSISDNDNNSSNIAEDFSENEHDWVEWYIIDIINYMFQDNILNEDTTNMYILKEILEVDIPWKIELLKIEEVLIKNSEKIKKMYKSKIDKAIEKEEKKELNIMSYELESKVFAVKNLISYLGTIQKKVKLEYELASLRLYQELKEENKYAKRDEIKDKEIKLPSYVKYIVLDTILNKLYILRDYIVWVKFILKDIAK